MMLNKINIGWRLSSGFLLIILLLASVTIFGINRMDLLSKQTIMMHNHPLTVSNAVLRINANIIKIHRGMKDVALALNDDDIKESSKIVNKLEKEIYKDFEIIDKRFLGEKEKYKNALQVFTEWKPIRDEVISLMRAGSYIEAANITKNKGANHVIKIEKAMEALGDFAQAKAQSFLSTATSIKNSALNGMYLRLFIAIVAGIALALFLTRSITHPIAVMKKATSEIGKGKLDTKIDVKAEDEIGQLANSFNKMVEDLHRANEQIKQREEMLKEAEKIASVGHWGLNIATNDLYWSDETFRIFDLEPQELQPTYGGFYTIRPS